MNSFHSRSSRPAPAKAVRTVSAEVRRGVRADVRLLELGLAVSRGAARRLIEQGRVQGPQGPIHKPSQELPPETRLTLLEQRQTP